MSEQELEAAALKLPSHFIAAGPSPGEVAAFHASDAARSRVADLLRREKGEGLSADETSELDHALSIEHLMRLAKARAPRHVAGGGGD